VLVSNNNNPETKALYVHARDFVIAGFIQLPTLMRHNSPQEKIPQAFSARQDAVGPTFAFSSPRCLDNMMGFILRRQLTRFHMQQGLCG
jgi:hypothetical protein